MMTAIEERDKALSVIDPFLLEISTVYRDCYLSEGKGALLVYADSVINGTIPTEYDYTTKNDVLEIIDGIDSKASLAALLSVLNTNCAYNRPSGFLYYTASISSTASYTYC